MRNDQPSRRIRPVQRIRRPRRPRCPGTDFFYWRLTLLATLGGFLFGYDTSNIGSALNFVPYHLSGFWQGYLVAGASLGAAFGALAAGTLTDRYGRKILLITDAAIYAFGAILSAVTPDAAVLLAARTMIGLAIGADTAIATAYIAEYAPKGRRGSLAMLQQWMITVGILGAYLVALVVLRAVPASAGTVGWRMILGLGAVPALVGLVLRTSRRVGSCARVASRRPKRHSAASASKYRRKQSKPVPRRSITRTRGRSAADAKSGHRG